MPTQISVTSYYYRRGGAEAVMLDQNTLLEENGWDIVPFAMEYDQNFATAVPRDGLQQADPCDRG